MTAADGLTTSQPDVGDSGEEAAAGQAAGSRLPEESSRVVDRQEEDEQEQQGGEKGVGPEGSGHPSPSADSRGASVDDRCRLLMGARQHPLCAGLLASQCVLLCS